MSLEPSLSGTVALLGFVNKQSNTYEPYIFNKIFEKKGVESIKVLTDDIPFARKRLVNPKSVYSGLVDILQYESVDSENWNNLETALAGANSLICFNVSMHQLAIQVAAISRSEVKRVVFGVATEDNPNERGENVTLPEICNQLSSAGVTYTIIKYGDIQKMEEAKYPYRIVRDALPVPQRGATSYLSSEDLFRVLNEAVDLPMSYNKVYGMGPGTVLDSEILIYMKSQGWSERVQVGLLMGDFMERMEKRYIEEKTRNMKLKDSKGIAEVPSSL